MADWKTASVFIFKYTNYTNRNNFLINILIISKVGALSCNIIHSFINSIKLLSLFMKKNAFKCYDLFLMQNNVH